MPKTTVFSIDSCKLIDLPVLNDVRGSLSFIEADKHIPFPIKRIYSLYDLPAGVKRGAHAHKTLHQLIIAMSGSFDIHLDDGYAKKSFHLSNCHSALYVCPMIWREIDGFSLNSVCTVLASAYYDEGDYFRNYDDFLSSVKKNE